LLADFRARLAGINVGSPARSEPSGDFGLIGLAVMGQNLIMNAADHGFKVIAFNRTVSKVDKFLENEAKGRQTGLLDQTVLMILPRQAHRGRTLN
jgi:phosphoglycerate dehydrogenase-like enzyme